MLFHILISGGGSVNQASRPCSNVSQAIQWFAARLAVKTSMTVIVPTRVALGFAATLLASSLAAEAHAAGRLALAAGRPFRGPAAGGIAQRRGAARRHRLSVAAGLEDLLAHARAIPGCRRASTSPNRTMSRPSPFCGRRRPKFDDGAGGHSLGYHDQVVLPLRIVAKNADKPVTLRADDQLRGLRETLHSRRSQCRAAFTSVASTEDGALSAALDTVPKPANVGDPNPLTIRDVKRDGKSTVLVDVVVARMPETSICSSKDRRRTGRCRCRSWSSTARPGSSASPSNSTACRRAPTLTARRSN